MGKIKRPSFDWQSQQLAPDCEKIDCPAYHPYKNFKADPTGYYTLIKVDFEFGVIDVGICNATHQVQKIFSGRKAQDIYHAIFTYELENKVEWFSAKSHLAYLGKELKKAELALVMGNSAYYQE